MGNPSIEVSREKLPYPKMEGAVSSGKPHCSTLGQQQPAPRYGTAINVLCNVES